jgi:hypothetical protein
VVPSASRALTVLVATGSDFKISCDVHNDVHTADSTSMTRAF